MNMTINYMMRENENEDLNHHNVGWAPPNNRRNRVCVVISTIWPTDTNIKTKHDIYLLVYLFIY